MSEVENRFRVKFTSDTGAKYAEAGRFDVYSQAQLVSGNFPGIEVGEGNASVGVYGMDNIQRLRDLCDVFITNYKGE